MPTSILSLIRPVMLLVFSVAFLTVLIATSGWGMILWFDETLCLRGCVDCPSHPVGRLIVLRFSRFLNFHFIDSFKG
jgi:hypothetical protein